MNSISKVGATLLLAIGLCLGGVSVQADGSKPSPTPKPAKPSPTPKPNKPSPTPKPGRCVVCEHEGGKNKDKQIACDKVDEFLRSNPSASRGPCVPTPVTNP